ncbi:endonuclease domain-containing protein [Mannheimia sp. HC-2023]|uniref:endonuclease domain-containing protein n=1 Tax=Mannheimia indoligenes TaxID=3103145 RepID=UPI002FE58679
MKPYAKSLKPNSQTLRSTQTDAEKRLWYRVRSDQLGFRFYRQKPLLSYIVDFYCPKAKLVIELDGSQHYEPEHQTNDKIRDAELVSLGLTVLRFDNYRVMTEIDSVIEEIWLYLQSVGE